ncbi:hypothetical protein [Spirosoma panaciterrae]|uniref:hypothetical protein n=1 Tax=Spirosoma panaciterrae TaxID=496058 RepID=UPI0012FCC586|nr:hypothetical protein [Spirosoma panaciterrae]
MKPTILLITLLSITLLFNACKKEEATPQAPVNLVKNGDMESYPWQDWVPYFGYNLTSNPNGYTNAYTLEAATSGTHSIKASCTSVKNDSTFYMFVQQFFPQTLKVGDKLTLKAKIKTDNLAGQGVSLVIRGDQIVNGKSNMVFFTTSQGKTVINGTGAFKEYAVTLDSYPGTADYISVYLIYLPQTTGTVYFDDVSLTAN